MYLLLFCLQHPFVAAAVDEIQRNSGISPVLKQLIDDNFATIEESRMRGESEEDGVESVPDGEDEEQGTSVDDAGSQSGGTGTIRRPRPAGSANITGTMQRNVPSSSGTMRQLKTGVVRRYICTVSCYLGGFFTLSCTYARPRGTLTRARLTPVSMGCHMCLYVCNPSFRRYISGHFKT